MQQQTFKCILGSNKCVFYENSLNLSVFLRKRANSLSSFLSCRCIIWLCSVVEHQGFHVSIIMRNVASVPFYPSVDANSLMKVFSNMTSPAPSLPSYHHGRIFLLLGYHDTFSKLYTARAVIPEPSMVLVLPVVISKPKTEDFDYFHVITGLPR